MRDIHSCYFNRNKVKHSEKLSAPVSENVLEYEKRFQVERQRKFIAIIFVSPLTRILIKVLSLTFICLLYCRMHINKTDQLSVLCIDSTRTTESMEHLCHFKISRETKLVFAELQHGTSLGRFCFLYSDSLGSSRRKGMGKGISRKEKNAPVTQAISRPLRSCTVN